MAPFSRVAKRQNSSKIRDSKMSPQMLILFISTTNEHQFFAEKHNFLKIFHNFRFNERCLPALHIGFQPVAGGVLSASRSCGSCQTPSSTGWRMSMRSATELFTASCAVRASCANSADGKQ